MASEYPCPNSPSRCSCFTFTDSNLMVQVSEALIPILFSRGPLVIPGEREFTRKEERLFFPPIRSVKQNTMYSPALLPLVIHFFSPSIIKSNSTCLATVLRLARSDPLCGSERQNAPIIFPEASFVNHSFFCAGVPKFSSDQQARELFTETITAATASTLAISSRAST